MSQPQDTVVAANSAAPDMETKNQADHIDKVQEVAEKHGIKMKFKAFMKKKLGAN